MANKNYLDKSGLSYFWGKIKSALNGKVNTSDLSTVATSGSYNDLSNKPSIPTKTSDLTNDSGFVTSEVSVSTTQPSEDFELWINPNESVNVYGNYISNTYGTSTEIGYSQNYANNCNTYSTTEVDTGKTWIDGSKIYQIVIDTTDTNTTNQWKNYIYSTLGIPNNATNVRCIEANQYMTQGGAFIGESLISSGCRLQIDETNKRFSILGNGSSYSKYIIIVEYTKSS